MAMNKTSVYILREYIKSGLHQRPNDDFQRWPKEAIVVCKIVFTDKIDEIVIEHNILHGYHAEKILMEKVNSRRDIKGITIYTNYSPCIECSLELQKLKENVPDLQIKFSSLYNIKRPSCTRSTTCECHEVLDKKDATTMSPSEASMKHSERFRMLTELDALPFQKEDWDDLINLLMRNDELNRLPPSDLRGIRDGDKYRDWRNGEDEKMKADYQTLSAQICPSTPNKNTSSTDEPSGPSKGDPAMGSTGDVKPRAIEF